MNCTSFLMGIGLGVILLTLAWACFNLIVYEITDTNMSFIEWLKYKP